MIKKFMMVAAAVVLYSAVPASAQGVNVQIGGDGYHRGPGYRGDGFRRSRADFARRDRGYHRDFDRRRNRTIVIER